MGKLDEIMARDRWLFRIGEAGPRYEGSLLMPELEATAARASSGRRSAFVRMSVVVHSTRREFSTAGKSKTH